MYLLHKSDVVLYSAWLQASPKIFEWRLQNKTQDSIEQVLALGEVLFYLQEYSNH